MEQIKPETIWEEFARMRNAINSMSQEQIDACAWVMGGDGVGWTRKNMLDAIPTITRYSHSED